MYQLRATFFALISINRMRLSNNIIILPQQCTKIDLLLNDGTISYSSPHRNQWPYISNILESDIQNRINYYHGKLTPNFFLKDGRNFFCLQSSGETLVYTKLRKHLKHNTPLHNPIHQSTCLGYHNSSEGILVICQVSTSQHAALHRGQVFTI